MDTNTYRVNIVNVAGYSALLCWNNRMWHLVIFNRRKVKLEQDELSGQP